MLQKCGLFHATNACVTNDREWV